ncbi:hypothetical protein SAY87_022306 [Trapa incisa]|uniref:Uncharacterized protein n=1 Tax=Trapa incisa TaxID=236973 RepID=A0AAN7KA11_9MYRT|nr:hypothetical protein SAY87_022306 [Trapa incisa]
MSVSISMHSVSEFFSVRLLLLVNLPSEILETQAWIVIFLLQNLTVALLLRSKYCSLMEFVIPVSISVLYNLIRLGDHSVCMWLKSSTEEAELVLSAADQKDYKYVAFIVCFSYFCCSVNFQLLCFSLC